LSEGITAALLALAREAAALAGQVSELATILDSPIDKLLY